MVGRKPRAAKAVVQPLAKVERKSRTGKRSPIRRHGEGACLRCPNKVAPGRGLCTECIEAASYEGLKLAHAKGGPSPEEARKLEQSVLDTLRERGPMHMRDLVATLKADYQQVDRAVSRLKKRGHTLSQGRARGAIVRASTSAPAKLYANVGAKVLAPRHAARQAKAAAAA